MADYFYAAGGQQQGPVSEEQLDGMVRSGTVPVHTLVWTAGMKEWQPYSVVKPQVFPPSMPGGPAVVCSVCHQSFPSEQVIRYGAVPVCVNCNRNVAPNLPAGMTGLNARYAGFWIRLVAKLIDGIVLNVVGFVLMLSTGGMNPSDEAALLLNGVSFVLVLAYSTFMVGRFGQTLGKMALGLKVVRADGGDVDYLRAFGRAAAEWLSGCTLLIGYIIAAFDPEKRTLHDHLARTRVIMMR